MGDNVGVQRARSNFFSKESVIYFAILVAAVAIYFGIRAFGDTLKAPAPASMADAMNLGTVHVNDFLHVLLALTLVIAAARLLGVVFRWVHQPPVVGEMLAGILLGPSFLGHFAPHAAAQILPNSVAPLLNVVSQFGVILYMFLVGLELDLPSLRSQAQSTLMISHASIVAPFLAGSSLALVLYPLLSNSSVSFTSFSLFLGVSMSVTAFPVLARILTDRRIHKTRMGSLTLACAAIDDVTAWCLLAFVVSVTQAHSGSVLRVVSMAMAYIAAMLFLARPLIARSIGWIDSRGRLSQGILAFVLLGILLSSLATESIGIHSIFGAFVLGAIIPHNSGVARELTEKLEDFVIVFLLPAFFAFTGLRTQIGLVSGWQNWSLCLLIIVVASLGKFGGSSLAARCNGISWRDASAIGILMNTRGLMELIVLNIGLELHVISPQLFAMLVLMALATTLSTTPILHFVMPREVLESEAHQIAEADRLSNLAGVRAGVLIPISRTSAVSTLLDVAARLSTPDSPPPRVMALNRIGIGGVTSSLRPNESLTLSRVPVLAAALDAAWSKKLLITPEAVSTTDAETEIIEASERTQVRWLLLESQRSLFGRYPRRSVVSRVLKRAEGRGLNVAVLLSTSSLQPGPVTCLVSDSDHDSAAVELGEHLCAASNHPLRVVVTQLVTDATQETSNAVPDWIRRMPSPGEPMTVSVTGAQSPPTDLPTGTIVISTEIVQQFNVDLAALVHNDRTVILVQGAGTNARPHSTNEIRPVSLKPLAASAT